MPHRTGKRDYLALMGLVSDMEITLIDGVNGSEMHPDGLPPVSETSNPIKQIGGSSCESDLER